MIPDDVDEDEVEDGERFARSPITGTVYRVTRWIEQDDGRIVALEKEAIDDEGGTDA